MGDKKKGTNISHIVRAIGQATLNNLPDILELIPGTGILLKTGAKLIIGGINESQNIKEKETLNNQLVEIKKAIDENQISLNEIKATILSQVISQGNLQDEKKCVYMSGFVLYGTVEDSIDEEIREELRPIFSERNEDEVQQEPEACIRQFLEEYYFGEQLIEGQDYFFLKDQIVMNLYVNDIKCIRNEQNVINFIAGLNEFVNKNCFSDYAIF